jgi:ATP-binding cassette subfamily F protein uup
MARTVLLSVDSISKAFGSRPVFEGLTFGLAEGDHVGIVGPNGAGKSTFLKILAGLDESDSGTRSLRRGVRIGFVPQVPTFEGQTEAERVAGEARSVREVLEAAYDATGHADHIEPHARDRRVGSALRRAGFDDDTQAVRTLSGGWRKRLAIVAALLAEPDVLLMDEPTNHLDVEGILWLESILEAEARAFVVVSHDRYFLENIATRVIEINRMYPEGLFGSDGGYSAFLEKRDELMRNQASYQDSLANLVRREVEWLRRGAKARTRKAQARIDNAERMITELDESRSRMQTSSVGIEFTASDRRTKRLLHAHGVTKRFEGRLIVNNLEVLLTPSLRLGLLGPNGSGKTTLLNLLDGTLQPDAGTVERANALRVVRFNQNRETLDTSVPLRRALAPEGDTIIYQDRALHVAAWAKRFLFRAEQLDTPVYRLSGGEQARILIAKLMLQQADLLVLDEPTNDLDIPTLDVLEESLLEFQGALVLVTHDRYLLDRVSTQILALDGEGGSEYFADYSQWETYQRAKRAVKKPEASATGGRGKKASKKSLSYAEKKELDDIETTIAAAEDVVTRCEAALADSSVATNADELTRRAAALDAAHDETARLYARWAELESKQNG